MLFSFPLFIHFARFRLIFSCHSLKAHYLLSSKINTFSDFEVLIEGNIWTQQKQQIGAKVHNESLHTLYASPKYEWGAEMKLVKTDRVCNTHKCENFFPENMNMRDNLGELGRVKRIILKVSLNKQGVKVFSWLRMMLIVQNVVMKLKDSFKGKELVAQLSNSQLPKVSAPQNQLIQL